MFYRTIELIKSSTLFLLKSFNHKPSNHEKKICFLCGFHGKTGGPIAIASIANMLARKYQVSFHTNVKSYFNLLLENTVQLALKPSLDADLFIVDLSLDLETMELLKATGKPIILTIHGFKDKSHSLSSEHIESMLEHSDKVHFVSMAQQDSYQLSDTKYFVIPNTVKKINKTQSTSNIGSVGNLDQKFKNAIKTIEYGLGSKCEIIHLWSANELAYADERVVVHSWENDKTKIFDSFDVLCFMSEQETFGLVVAEALSAGIPCILLDLPAFKAFEECSAVKLFSPKEQNGIPKAIDYFLENKPTLGEEAKRFYMANFSSDVVLKQWHLNVSELLT